MIIKIIIKPEPFISLQKSFESIHSISMIKKKPYGNITVRKLINVDYSR